MAVKNPHGLEVWIKPEGSDTPVKIGKEGWPGRQDGIAIPTKHPGKVFKSSDYIDLEIQANGSVKASYGNPLSNALQAVEGGWYEKPTRKMGKNWNKLFDRAKPKKAKKNNAPKRTPMAFGGEDRRRSVDNRDWLSRARDNGLLRGRSGGGGAGAGGANRGYVVIRYLN